MVSSGPLVGDDRFEFFDKRAMNTLDAIELQEEAWSLQVRSNFEGAALACHRALRLVARDRQPGWELDLANLLNDLAGIELERQDFPSAWALARHSLAICGRSVNGDGALIRINALELQGLVATALGNYPRAEQDLKFALEIAVTAFGEASRESISPRNNLGVVYKHWGRFEEALELYHQSLNATDEDYLDLYTIYRHIASVLQAQCKFADAEEPARKAWELSRALLGADDPHAMLNAAAYASVLAGLGRFEESEKIYRRAIQIFEKTYGPRHSEVAANLHGLAAARASRGAYQEAEQLYRRALEIQVELFGADSVDAALTRHNLGRLLNQCGRSQEAVPHLERSVAVLEMGLTPGHPHLTLARASLRAAAAMTTDVRSTLCRYAHDPSSH
jgi:tetratricopeptide (TPR) repeat protein